MNGIDQTNINKIIKFKKNLTKNILEMALNAGANSSHFGGALSIADIISTLFAYKMKFEKNNPKSENRDRFILSKGHACLAYYAALCEIGFIKKDDLKTFEENDSNLLGHPVRNMELGIEFSNGSLGMGLSLAIGVALALKKKNKKNNIFVIMGDGECNEGSVWEALMAAPNFNLGNITLIIDRNNFQQTGNNKSIMDLGNLKNKVESFGWNTTEIDGHNINKIYDYFKNIDNNNKPNALIANTIKGKGFSFSENNNSWHHSILTKDLYDKALSEMK
ncbi:transketolase [Candidatus Pelagibacter sp.]|nr:transketolase [Candidatus Pelagibacter sp.]